MAWIANAGRQLSCFLKNLSHNIADSTTDTVIDSFYKELEKIHAPFIGALMRTQ